MKRSGDLQEPESRPGASMDLRRGLGNASFLLSGNALSYAISLVTVVLVARPLGPSGYGTFNLVTAFVGLFGLSALNGFDKVMIREASGDEHRVESIFAQIVGLKLMVAVAAVVVCVAAAWVWPAYTEVERIGISLASAVLLCSPLMGALNAVFQTHERMQWVAIGGLVRQVLYVVLAATLVFVLQPSPLYVVTAFVISYVVAVIFSWRVASRFAHLRVSFKLRAMDRSILSGGFVFSLIQFFALLYTKVDVLMIRQFSTSTQVGLYAVAQTVFSRLNSSQEMLASAFFPQVVKRAKRGDLRLVDLRGGMFVLFLVGTGLAASGTLFLPYIIPLILGEAYAASVMAAQVLLWGLAISAPFVPLILMLQARHQEGLIARVAPVRAAVNVVLDIIVLSAGWGIVGVAAGSVATTLVYYALLLTMAWRRGFVVYRRDELRMES